MTDVGKYNTAEFVDQLAKPQDLAVRDCSSAASDE